MKISDVIIIGGGPAGLNAALVLGRCRRSVLLFDKAEQRNRLSRGIHNYVTQDGILPADFLKLAQAEIKNYSVSILKTEIEAAEKKQNNFILVDKKRNRYQSKKLLLATGLKDILPAIQGIESFFGSSVFHCPYCDAWEVKDKFLGVYSKKREGFELALALKTWSRDIMLFTDGRNYLKPIEIEILKRKKIPQVTTKIKSLEGSNGQLRYIILSNEKKIPCDALFLTSGYVQQSELAEKLGCRMSRKGLVITNNLGQTCIPGLYVAGDSSVDMQFVIVAAAEGAKAAVAIHKELLKEELVKSR